MIKFGYITELNVQEGTVRVHFTDDDIVSNPLQFIVPASKDDKYSFPFAINEHVSCLMDDNCEFGVVLGAVYSVKNKPDTGVSDSSVDININGKLKLKINRNTGDLKIQSSGKIELISTGEVKIESSGKVSVTATETEINSPTNTINGLLNVTGAVTAASFGGASGTPANAPNGFATDGDVIANGISLTNHVHISAGASNPTSPPQ